MQKFDFHNQLECGYGNHRSGWAFAVSALKDLHDPNAMYFDTFIERTYVWGQHPGIQHKAYIPNKEWVGMIHNPFIGPYWFDQGNTNEGIFNLPEWQESYKLCRGLFTLSEDHKRFLQNILDVPIDVVLHPMEVPDLTWSYERFRKNKQKSIVQIGWWLRNLHAIFEMPVSSYQKIFLRAKKEAWFDNLMETEKLERVRMGKFKESMYETAKILQFLPNEEFDKLLSENIGFVYLYNASANNAVVECIARNTPLLINKIQPVVEYLGNDYPLYYSSYEEALEKAHNHDLLLETHNYLKNMPIREKLTPEYFRKNIINSFLFSENKSEVSSNVFSLKNNTESVNTIYIVTPSFNAAETIDQTILSILSQSGPFVIRYHVQDGGSTDGTVQKLAQWKKRLENDPYFLQCKGINFTYESIPDKGMYDAIVNGFAKMRIHKNAFMTWLNADDIMMTGAIAFIHRLGTAFTSEHISWITGASYIIKDNHPIAIDCDRVNPMQIIKHGCADGKHWFDLQQEGTFFRKWLWDQVDADQVISQYRNAGDWNLWRLFANHTCPVTMPWPLAVFRLREGQLSQKLVDLREQEIEQTVSTVQRKKSLQSLTEAEDVFWRTLRIDWPGNNLKLVEKTAISQAYYHYHDVFKAWPPKKQNKESDKLENIIAESNRAEFQSLMEQSKNESNKDCQSTTYDTSNIPDIISIVTPSLNAAATIDETIESVITQKGDFVIRYHIQDGGSSDLTMERLQFWETVLSKPNPYVRCRAVVFTWTCELDNGMYDAIIKGFDQLDIDPDELMTWINADDVLLPNALSNILNIKKENPEVQWVGTPLYVFENDYTKPVLERETLIPTELIRKGLCDGKHLYMLQQEGTFFSKSLWFKAKNVLKRYKFAGDWALWKEIASYADYYQFENPLGAFRRKKNQLSVVNRNEYISEINKVLSLQKRSFIFNKYIEESMNDNMFCNFLRYHSNNNKISNYKKSFVCKKYSNQF